MKRVRYLSDKQLRKRMDAEGRIYLTDEETEMRRHRDNRRGFIVAAIVSCAVTIAIQTILSILK